LGSGPQVRDQIAEVEGQRSDFRTARERIVEVFTSAI
jgi:hypothetical protein